MKKGHRLSHYPNLEKLIGGRMRAAFKVKCNRLNRLMAPQGFSPEGWLKSGENETRTLATDRPFAG